MIRLIITALTRPRCYEIPSFEIALHWRRMYGRS